MKSTTEYCKECLEGTCNYHKWFTDSKPKTENDILITYLKHIQEKLGRIFEKVYIVENSVHDWREHIRTGGKLEFSFNEIPVVSKKDGEYIPVSCHSFSDDIVYYDIVIEVMLMRHHPTDIVIKKDIFTEDELYRVVLIDFGDNLHCESIHDYPEIVKLASMRLDDFVKRQKTSDIDIDLENQG